MTNTLTADLKPCPFCGGAADVRTYQDESLWSHSIVTKTQVGCNDCDYSFATEPGYEIEALELWNTRSPLPGEAVQWTEAHNAAAYLQHHIGEGDEGACNVLDTIDKFILSCSPLTNEPAGVMLSIEDASRLRDLCIAITKFKEGDIFFTRPDFPDLIARLTTAIAINGAQ